jgi:hypothetical protein
VVRLPHALSPVHQSLFRIVRELLPRLFSRDEKARYIRDLASLERTTAYNSLFFDGEHGTVCSDRRCSGALHANQQYYEELAEAFIGRVFTWADSPDDLRAELVDLFYMMEHAGAARTRTRRSPPELATALYARDVIARQKRQRV